MDKSVAATVSRDDLEPGHSLHFFVFPLRPVSGEKGGGG